MKIVVAPDSFGGWRTAPQIAQRLAESLEADGHTVVMRPMSDGGEGLLGVLGFGGLLKSVQPIRGKDPFGAPRSGPIGQLADGTFVVESSVWLRAVHTQTPWLASSRGLGDVLSPLVQQPVVVGLGGSSTVDMGLGVLTALGVVPEDASGRTLPPVPTSLSRVARFVGPPRPMGHWTVWCDVATPVQRGGRAFGPQKGVSNGDLHSLQAGWDHVRRKLSEWCAQHQLHAPPPGLRGGGAAGGLGYALAAMGARLVPGVDAMAALVLTDLDEPDLLITGEGRLDATSADDKVVCWLSKWCGAHNLPFAAVVGEVAEDAPPLPGPVFAAEGAPDRDRAFDLALGQLRAHISPRPISARRS